MCGDVCTNDRTPCRCNGTTTLNGDSPEFCCTSHDDDHCSFDGLDEDGYGNVIQPRCSSGSPTNKDEKCSDRNQMDSTRGRCYNSYQHSRWIGDDAHYSCPDGRCLPVQGSFIEERCRGVEGGVCTNTTGD